MKVSFYRNIEEIVFEEKLTIESDTLFYKDEDLLYMVSDDEYACFDFDEEKFKWYSTVEIEGEDPNR